MNSSQTSEAAALLTLSDDSAVKKDLECTSSSDGESLLETSSSTQSHERQNIPACTSLRISTLLSESDSQEVDSNNDEAMHSMVCSSEGVTQPKLLGPQPVVMVKKLTGTVIEELKAGIWRCASCGKAENSFLILDLHIDTGCEELSPIECDVCPAVVHDYRDFVAHFMEHQMGGRRKCPICLLECITDIKQHLIAQGHFSANLSELDLHRDESSVVSNNPSASNGLNSFESDNLDINKKKRSGKKQFKCDVCNKCFSTSRTLKSHQTLHTGKKPFKCDLCKKCFSQSSNLNVHRRVHTGEKPFICGVCKKCFSASSALTVHQRVHTGEKPYNCEICKKGFSQSSEFNTHKRVHNGEKPFKCDICKKCFSQSAHLTGHRRVHTREKPFKCNVCKKCFSQSSALNMHQRVHTGEKPFKCGICLKSFYASGDLKKHLRVHTGEKPFECDLCKKRFSQSSELNSHRKIETGKKPFKCDVCEKRFLVSSLLIRHQRVHTGEKPFKCNVCEKCFFHSSHLNRHQKLHKL